MIDIVFPANNEEAFLDMAEKLGYAALCFVYSKAPPIDQLMHKTPLKVCTAALYPALARNTIAKADLHARKLMEQRKVKMLFDFEQLAKRDSIHQRNSGLNQVLCTLAKQKGVAIGINVSTLREQTGILRARTIGRMMQNIALCRKYKTQLVLASFAKEPFEMRNPADLISVGVTLGMRPEEAKDACSIFQNFFSF